MELFDNLNNYYASGRLQGTPRTPTNFQKVAKRPPGRAQRLPKATQWAQANTKRSQSFKTLVCTILSRGPGCNSATAYWLPGPPSLQTLVLGSASLWLQEPGINFNHAEGMLSVIRRACKLALLTACRVQPLKSPAPSSADSCTPSCSRLCFKKTNVTIVTFSKPCKDAVLLACDFPFTTTSAGLPRCSFTWSPEVPHGARPMPPNSMWGCRGFAFS
jgi:hypothetical protein